MDGLYQTTVEVIPNHFPEICFFITRNLGTRYLVNTSLVVFKSPIVSETLIPSVLLVSLFSEGNKTCQLFLPSSKFQEQSSVLIGIMQKNIICLVRYSLLFESILFRGTETSEAFQSDKPGLNLMLPTGQYKISASLLNPPNPRFLLYKISISILTQQP